MRSATVYRGTEEIPSQLDDLNRDTQADELAFVADIPAGAKEDFRIVLSPTPSAKTYPARTYAQMRLNDKGQKCPHIQYITFDGRVPVKQSYSAMYHHGPAFESELVAFRAYMDNRQSIDLYGKNTNGWNSPRPTSIRRKNNSPQAMVTMSSGPERASVWVPSAAG